MVGQYGHVIVEECHYAPAVPIAWKGPLIQYAGRLHRLRPGKQEVQIRLPG